MNEISQPAHQSIIHSINRSFALMLANDFIKVQAYACAKTEYVRIYSYSSEDRIRI